MWELKCNESIFVIAPEAYSEPSEKSKTEHFVKRVESFQALTIFTKPPVLNIWLDYENNSEFPIHIIKSDRSVLNFSFSHQMLMLTVMSYTRDELHTWWATHMMSYTRDELHTWWATHVMSYTHDLSISKQTIRNIFLIIKTILNLNSIFFLWKTVLSLTL